MRSFFFLLAFLPWRESIVRIGVAFFSMAVVFSTGVRAGEEGAENGLSIRKASLGVIGSAVGAVGGSSLGAGVAAVEALGLAFGTLRGGRDADLDRMRARNRQDAWVRDLRAGNLQERLDALALLAGSHHPEAMDALVEALETDPAWPVRRDAAAVLSKRIAENPGLVPLFTDALLQEPEPGVRLFLVEGIGGMARDRRDVLIVLCEILAEGDSDVRAEAALALEGVTAIPASVLPALVEAFRTGEDYVRGTARELLSLQLSRAVPLVAEVLTDPFSGRRQLAAELLGEWGPASKAALGPLLATAFRDGEPAVRELAFEAIALVVPEATDLVEAIQAVLADPELYVQARGLLYGGWLAGLYAGLDAPRITAALSSRDRDVRRIAAFALAELGASLEMEPALLQAFADFDWWVRLQAVRALGPLARRSDRSAAALQRALGDGRKEVRLAAAQALRK